MASLLEESDFFISKSSVQFGETIGSGGFGQIRSANYTRATGDVVKTAAKKVRNVEAKEVQVMKEIKHSNVITFYGVLLDDPDTYIIMELAENGDLRRYLDAWKKEKKTRLPTPLIQKWTFESACGLHYLHTIHHTHRDIKSLNYLIMNDLTIKLGDLGLAKAMDLTTQETTGGRGTCRWMAPEVIKEQKRSVKSDVFSYGTVVWEIVTTEIPFAEVRGDFQVMNAICHGQRPNIPDDCPQHLKELIQLCWQDDYHKRPDMSSICEKLKKYEQMDTSAPSTEPVPREQLPENIVRDSGVSVPKHYPDEGPKVVKFAEGTLLSKPPSAHTGLTYDTSTSSGSVAMYKMCNVPRGVCLIINNVNFTEARKQGHKLLHDREGSHIDSDKLQKMFSKFMFSVECKTDLSCKEIGDVLDEVRRQDHTSANAFVCCILTHGKFGQLAGIDGKYIAIQEILNLFKPEKCPSLEKKPKIFFIQACQGTESQEKYELQTDAPQLTGIGIGLDETMPNQADFIVGYATVPGHISYRHVLLGSWYIDILVDKLQRLHDQEDLISILTEVNRKLSKKSAKELGKESGQVSLRISTLRKKVYFTTWVPASSTNEPTSRNSFQATRELDFQGGDLSLSKIGASLSVPKGALSEKRQVVNMSLSLYLGDDYPPIDDDHLMITPIMSCGPGGLDFSQPVTLELPHCVPSFKDGDFTPGDVGMIHLWLKSKKEDPWQKLPSMNAEGKGQSCWVKDITPTTIVLEANHFCNFGASASMAVTRQILMFMQPSRIAVDTKRVNVFVYAVQDEFVDVVKEKERKNAAVMCARENELEILQNSKELRVALKEILPKSKWEPAFEHKEISYKKLQRGNPTSYCGFCFVRKTENAETIHGQYDAQQEGNDEEVIKDGLFDIDMFPQLTSDPGSPLSLPNPVFMQPAIPDARVVQSSKPVDLDRLFPSGASNAEKLKCIRQWRDVLQKPSVSNELIPILTVNMLDNFSAMSIDDKQLIQNKFTYKSSRIGAEAFLDKMSSLGYYNWPRELFTALSSANCFEYCCFLEEVYKKSYGQAEPFTALIDFDDILIESLDPDQLRLLYPKLGLSEAVIRRVIASTNSNNVTLQAKAVFREWRQRNPEEATIEAMITALQSCRFNLQAQNLQCLRDVNSSLQLQPQRENVSDYSLQHLTIWATVIQQSMGLLCTHLDPDHLIEVLDEHTPNFVAKYNREFRDMTRYDSGNRAFRWLLDKLSKFGEAQWSTALEVAIKDKEPLSNSLRAKFEEIHNRQYSSCPCRQTEGSQSNV